MKNEIEVNVFRFVNNISGEIIAEYDDVYPQPCTGEHVVMAGERWIVIDVANDYDTLATSFILLRS
jgi:hypothetical protein